ncbi:MAG: ATP-binding protein [Hyphomicrobium sp.]
MLLEYRVSNYRSFGDESGLSLVASGDKSKADTNTVAVGGSGSDRALRAAVLYGANASGKSNLVRGMLLMQLLVLNSFQQKPDQPLEYQPFMLDTSKRQKPIMFEVTVVIDGVRHQYGFEFTKERITSEWLLVYKKAKPQKWIERDYDPETGKDTIKFGTSVQGQRAVWEEATRPNALALSTAVQLNSEALKPLYQWFAEAFVIVREGGFEGGSFTTQSLGDGAEREAIGELMRNADVGIASVSYTERQGFRREVVVDMQTGEAKTGVHEGLLRVPQFVHKAGEHAATFELDDESEGTRKLYGLAGPIRDILRTGKTLVIDELDRSLHPLIVRKIVEAFQSGASNPSGAQLIFTTHDTSLLDGGLLRRDQVWFVEKNAMQESDLVPLLEFSPRKGEALERGYLEGRYGGIPVLAERLVAGGGRGDE